MTTLVTDLLALLVDEGYFVTCYETAGGYAVSMYGKGDYSFTVQKTLEDGLCYVATRIGQHD
jgi:hypothetical protein